MSEINFPAIISPSFFRDTNILLILLLAAVIFSLWHAFSIIYHLIRFGIGTAPKKAALVFLAGTMLFLVIAVIMYVQANWFL